MSTKVDISDISVTATRVVRQYSYGQLDDILQTEQGVEGFFDYYDEWEDDDIEDFEYEVEVAGVISASLHSRRQEDQQAEIDRQKKTIEELREKVADRNNTIERLTSQIKKHNVKGEEE